MISGQYIVTYTYTDYKRLAILSVCYRKVNKLETHLFCTTLQDLALRTCSFQ